MTIRDIGLLFRGHRIQMKTMRD